MPTTAQFDRHDVAGLGVLQGSGYLEILLTKADYIRKLSTKTGFEALPKFVSKNTTDSDLGISRIYTSSSKSSRASILFIQLAILFYVINRISHLSGLDVVYKTISALQQ